MDLVLIGKYQLTAFLKRPVDRKCRIVIHDTALIVRMIKIRNLITELGIITHNIKAVSKSLGYEKLLLVLSRKLNSEPLAECL